MRQYPDPLSHFAGTALTIRLIKRDAKSLESKLDFNMMAKVPAVLGAILGI